MSFISPTSDVTSPLSTGTPVVDQADEPASIRAGNKAAKNAYATGTAFEQMLMSQLTQQLSATISGSGSADNGLGGSTSSTDPAASLGGTDDGGSTDPVSGAYSSMLPDALTSSIMSSGGTGIAMEIARAIDPALNGPTASTAPGSTATGSTATGSTGVSGGTGTSGAGQSTVSGGAALDPMASELG